MGAQQGRYPMDTILAHSNFTVHLRMKIVIQSPFSCSPSKEQSLVRPQHLPPFYPVRCVVLLRFVEGLMRGNPGNTS